MKVLFAYQNSNFTKEIEYIVNLLFYTYEAEIEFMTYDHLARFSDFDSEILISYGSNKPETITFGNHIHIYESNFFGHDYLATSSLPDEPLKYYQELPVIYGGSGFLSDWVKITKSQDKGIRLETNIDILASSFFMVTRYEEVVDPVEDEYNRFPASASFAYREGFLERPIVNEYISLVSDWFEDLNLPLQRKELWDGKKVAVSLTHDVDRLRKFRSIPPLYTLKKILLNEKSLQRAFKLSYDYFINKIGAEVDPYKRTHDKMIRQDSNLGCKSTFFVMANEARYMLGVEETRKLSDKIMDKGFEIGLHGSLESYKNASTLGQERHDLEKVINQPVSGNRQHYLKLKIPETWRCLEKAGFQYDSTLGFADHPGFRAGTCFPYKPFDVEESKVIDIWEIPLTVMDSSLFEYQNLSAHEALEKVRKLWKSVAEFNGAMMILWHNTSLYKVENPRTSKVYQEIINYLERNNVFCDTAGALLEEWTSYI